MRTLSSSSKGAYRNRTPPVTLGALALEQDTPWTSIAQHILRIDLGLDVAAQYATEDHRRIVHVIPRAGVGVMQQCDLGWISLETALAYDPFVERDGGVRWSAGVTGMLKLGWPRRSRNSAFRRHGVR
jgi:hypothetical protein